MFNNKIGLVLGGGGARGFFHMGVIKAIQELGIKIDYISGTSIGALIGAIYASNPSVDFNEIINKIDFLKLTQSLVLATRNNSSSGLQNFLKSYISATSFSDLKIPLVFNASDINNKKEIVFNQGPLFPGLMASISIPGVFFPTQIDNQFLVDGGVLNNIPISLLPKLSKIIVSDITGPIKKVDQKSLPLDILYSSIALMQQNNSLQKINSFRQNKIVYLNLSDDQIFILDFRKKNYQVLIDLGYQSLISQKDRF